MTAGTDVVDQIEAVRTGKAGKTGSLRELFVHQWRPLLLCFLITAGGTLASSSSQPGLSSSATSGTASSSASQKP